ncbi:MAG: sulfur carrier protein ThiS [Gammaproteobacteria bacterium]|nr:sulfur carrier protein ThiS [Gammaproteobacteria bacterium]
MELVVNGERRTLENVTTVAELLDHLQMQGRLAVELNGVIVPRSRHADESLATGDTIEIVHAVGGG